MSNLQLDIEQMVRDFHEKYGHYVGNSSSTKLPAGVLNLRFQLIREEFFELNDAMVRDDIIDIADGAADLIYVIVGTMVSMGIPIGRVFREVHNSNMTKTPVRAEPGQKYGTKTPKGEEYLAPDIHKILIKPYLKTTLEVKNLEEI